VPDEQPHARVPLYTADLSRLDGTPYLQMCDIRQTCRPPQLTEGAALWLDDQGLLLINAALQQPLRLNGTLLERRWQGRSMLLRACGATGGGCSVLDPFAGFGLDALTLVHFGCDVSACEQHPLVWLMQWEFAQRMGLRLGSVCGDGVSHMAEAHSTWDIVYLDPMFPTRRKRALPNLALQHLQQLARPNPTQTAAADRALDVAHCLALARNLARRRVVLKRRPKDPVLGRPSHQIKGQAVRFDVYL